jgi:hypothetical protein
MDLSQDLQELVEQWCRRQAPGARRQAEGTGPGSAYAADPKMFYWDELSVAPGWKVGGWPTWGLTDPIPLSCPDCGTLMVPLLTIASTEWDRNSRGWIPIEDQALADTPRYLGAPTPHTRPWSRSPTTTTCSSTPARHRRTILTLNWSSESGAQPAMIVSVSPDSSSCGTWAKSYSASVTSVNAQMTSKR